MPMLYEDRSVDDMTKEEIRQRIDHVCGLHRDLHEELMELIDAYQKKHDAEEE